MKVFLIALLILSPQLHADKAADSHANNYDFKSRGGTDSGKAVTAGSTQGLLTPDMDRGLWGIGSGSIPTVGHLAEKLGGRRKGDFCGQEFKRIAEAQKKINATQIPKPLDVLKKAVAPYKISDRMLEKTLAVFLRNQTQIPNQRFITIFDHTQASTAKRFVVLDLWNGTAKGYRSAHGMGSDPKHTGKAQTFGNDPRGNTNKSSVGCALVAHRYRAKVTSQEPRGRWAMTILGFETTNDNSCDRGVYMHAAPYVDYEKGVGGSAKVYASKPGRSWGCPAFTYRDRDEIFSQIDGGGLMCSWGSDK